MVNIPIKRWAGSTRWVCICVSVYGCDEWCCHVSISVSLTYPSSACQLLLSQQEPVSIESFNQVHGLGNVGEAATFCHHRKDGHFPPDIATLTLTVNDKHRHRVPTLLQLRTKHTAGITHMYSLTNRTSLIWMRKLDSYSSAESRVCERWHHDSIDPDQSVSSADTSFLCWTISHCAHNVPALLTWWHINTIIIINDNNKIVVL